MEPIGTPTHESVLENIQDFQVNIRPLQHLAALARLYPEAWDEADAMSYYRGQDGTPDWPDWCYVPYEAWYEIATRDRGRHEPSPDLSNTPLLAAIGQWRVTQGIYRFEPALYHEVVNTPIASNLSHQLLRRLPEWSVYVETPGMYWGSERLYGFFAHLDYEPYDEQELLRIVLDLDGRLGAIHIRLGPWPLAESISRELDEASSHLDAIAARHFAEAMSTYCIQPLVSLLVYLCGENANVVVKDRLPIPEHLRAISGRRQFLPTSATIWNVGAGRT